MVKDYKENAPCGMLIHYTVDLTTDFIVYDDINGRGQWKKTEKCDKCSWRAMCKPTSMTEELRAAYKKGFDEGYIKGAKDAIKSLTEVMGEFGIGIEV